MSKINIKKVDHEEAYRFWQRSKQNIIFNNPNLLKEFSLYKFDYWQITYGEEKICLWPISILIKDKKIKIPDFFYYFGPSWYSKDIKQHKLFKITLDVYNNIIEKLISEYGEIQNELHFSLNDVRAFQWWNYNKKNKFQITPRYSAIIHAKKINDDNDILKNFRYVRRYEIKKFKKEINYFITDQIKNNEIIEMYKNTLGKDISSETEQTLNDFLTLSKKINSEIICLKNKKNEEIISASLLIDSKNYSNLILNLNNKKYKEIGSAPTSIFEILKIKKNKILDFNGANSPDRADDKHSYGSETKLFFTISFANDKNYLNTI